MFHAEQFIEDKQVAEAINELMDLYVTVIRRLLMENKEIKEISKYIIDICSTQCKEGEDVKQLFLYIWNTHEGPITL